MDGIDDVARYKSTTSNKLTYIKKDKIKRNKKVTREHFFGQNKWH